VLDLLISGGTVVDGTGAPRRLADVGVKGGRIAVIGEVDEPAVRTVDATGLIVAPGFVDIHTHYDAQLLWDPTASPSPLHGVTTVFGGNCGFSLAPAGEQHNDYIMRMMAKVEGMPLAALEQGLPWDWSSFPEWLDRMDRPFAVNAGFLCGHSALRRAVMGDDAVGGAASPRQIDDMVRLLRDALAAGAMGFSTSTAPPHHDGAGRPVPSRAATRDEFLALAGALHDHAGTTLELILAGCLNLFSAAEIDLMTSMSLAANRPVNWNVLGVSAQSKDRCRQQLEASTAAAAHGARVVALTLPRGNGMRMTFLTGAPLDGLPGWREVFELPPHERIRAFADPEVRRRLAAGALSEDAGALRYVANWPSLQIVETFAPSNRAYEGRGVADVAIERGQEPFDALLDIVIDDGLRTGLRPPATPDTHEAWEYQTEVWRDERTIIGGSDAGAHLDMMCGAVYSTSLLAGVRTHGGITLEEAVQMLSDAPARLYGVRERGRLVDGWHADLVLFDPDTVGFGAESTRYDLPGGAGRLYAGSTGVEHVFTNGTAVVAEGLLTGATPGGLLRSGRDSESVTVPGGG
jgi:N-acyl-D-aspartate/D-glutamate deacylase